MSQSFSIIYTSVVILIALIFFLGSRAAPRNFRDVIKCLAEKNFPLKLLPGKEIGSQNAAEMSHLFRRGEERARLEEHQDSTGRGLSNLEENTILALSKLANIRLSSLAREHMEQRSIPIISDRKRQVNGTEVSDKDPDPVPVRPVPKLEFKPRTFHCHPIEDYFIPTIDKKLPAYICKLEFRQFIISSDRFFHESRHSLDLAVDEATFHRLVIRDDEITGAGNSMASIIPVTLTQREGDESYGLRRT